MPATRKRAAKTSHKGTAGKSKTAQRKSPASKARTASSGRVKGARGGPATRKHPQRTTTKRASSGRRTSEAAEEPLASKRAKGYKLVDEIDEIDVARVPGMRRAKMRDKGLESR
jgi:hypothetical protein